MVRRNKKASFSEENELKKVKVILSKFVYMPFCRFCDQHINKLCKSHIIPESFFRYMKSNSKLNEAFQQISNTLGKQPIGRIQIGWYDRSLVCNECEKLFGPYDSYASEILLNAEANHTDIGPAYVIKDLDYDKLKLFFISVLWRAGASSKDQFKKVQLGPFLNYAKKAIENSFAGDENFFSVVLARFIDFDGKQFMADPHPESRLLFDGIMAYRFYLGAGYVFYIKVDKRPFPSFWQQIAFSSHQPLFIVKKRGLFGTREGSVMKKVYADAIANLKSLKL